MTLKEAVDRFLEYCELDKSLSQKTVRMYAYYLHFFQEWMKNGSVSPALSNKKNVDENKSKIQASSKLESIPIEDINEETIRRFRLYLSRDYFNPFKGELKRQTQNYFLVALRSLFRFLIKKGHAVLSPEQIDLGKSRDRNIKFLSDSEVQKLLMAPDPESIAGRRDRAILETLFSTGLRVSELTRLNRDQVNLSEGEFGIIGKGGRARVVFMSESATQRLREYLDRRDDPYKPLFIRYSGPKAPEGLVEEKARLTPRSVERMVEKYRVQVGIPVRIGPHVLRHSFATDLLSHGADIRSVQMMLGHKNISTTQVYTHLTDPQLRQVHQKFHSGNKNG